MLAPKRVQWRKVMKSDLRGHAQTGNDVSYGDYGLMAIECGYLTSRQIEAARISMTRKVKRGSMRKKLQARTPSTAALRAGAAP